MIDSSMLGAQSTWYIRESTLNMNPQVENYSRGLSFGLEDFIVKFNLLCWISKKQALILNGIWLTEINM